MGLEGVAQPLLQVQYIGVAPADAMALEDARLLQVIYDQLNSAFSDADIFRDAAQRSLRRSGKADQHVPVVAQEGPAIGAHACPAVCPPDPLPGWQASRRARDGPTGGT